MLMSVAGCNPKLKNRDGLTARLLAKQNGRKLAVKECRRAESTFGTPKDLVTPVWAVALYDFCYYVRVFTVTPSPQRVYIYVEYGLCVLF
jgi:hypothetical protein